MADDVERVNTLAGRVRWLDRYRRVVAIAIAALAAPPIMAVLDQVLGTDWPEMHATLLMLMIGVMLWWFVEVGLVWITAVWETEHDRLIRDRGMPPARIIVRK
jgi:hypothetical protein